MKPKIWGKIAILAILVVAIAGAVILKNAGSSSPGPQPASSATVEQPGAPVDQPAEVAEQLAVKTEQPANKQGTAPLPRLLELGSDSCRPCQMMQPILAELRTEYPGKLQVDFIDVWKDESAGRKYGIQAIPTQIFFDAKGKEISRHVGFYPKEDILATFKEQGISL